jgi:hypothetical protein
VRFYELIKILTIKKEKKMTLDKALKKINSENCPAGLQLDLECYKIDDNGAQALAEALASGNCPTGLGLDLSENEIGHKGAQAFAKALASGNCPTGLELILYYNNIGIKGAHAFVQALASGKCKSGLMLNLGRNKIGDKGAQALAQALASGNCPSGLQINLLDNKIGVKGAQALAEALESGNCPSGLQIDLLYNRIGDKGAQALAEALNSGHCRFGTTICLNNKKYDFIGLNEKNNKATHQAALGIAIMIGGFSHCNKQPTSRLMTMLPEAIVNHIAGFLPGHISAIKITTYLKKSFIRLMKTNSEFVKKHRSHNPVNQHLYDKQYGLSLWECGGDNGSLNVHNDSRLSELLMPRY